MFEAAYTVLVAVGAMLYGYCWGRDDGRAGGFEKGYLQGLRDGDTTKGKTT